MTEYVLKFRKLKHQGPRLQSQHPVIVSRIKVDGAKNITLIAERIY